MKNKQKKFRCLLMSVMSLAMVGCFAFGARAAFGSANAEEPATTESNTPTVVPGATQWDIQAVGTKVELLSNGNYLVTEPGNYGNRAGTAGAFDFGSFEMSFDMTRVSPLADASPAGGIFFGFSAKQNGYFNYDGNEAENTIFLSIRKTSATSAIIGLFDTWGNMAANATFGTTEAGRQGEVSLDLTASQIIAMSIVKTDTKLTLNFNDQKMEYDVNVFYGESRQVFKDAGFNGGRYLIIGSMSPYTIEISPFKDESFKQGADVIIAAVEAYENAAKALADECVMDDVTAAVALKGAINLESEALTAEQKAELTVRVQAADELIEIQRKRIVVAGINAQVVAYEDAATSLTELCTQTDVDAADALKAAINLGASELTEEERTALQARVDQADALVEVQRLRLAAEAGGNPVVGDWTMTPWTYHIANTDAKLLYDGSYRVTVPGGGFGTRAAYGPQVDFGTFEVSMNFSEVETGSFPDWLLFMFVKSYNHYMSEDEGSLVVAFERCTKADGVLTNQMRALLYNKALDRPLTDPSGKAYEVSFVLPESQDLLFKIEKTEAAVVFHFNEAEISVPVSYFYGDDRKVFNTDGDVFDGKRYLTFGTQRAGGADMVVTMSEFRDAETIAYNDFIAPTIEAVTDFVAAATSLTNDSDREAFLAVEALGESINLNIEGIRAYTKNNLSKKVAAANVILAKHRARLAAELVGTYIEEFEKTVAAIADKATLMTAESTFDKIDMSAVEAITDEELKAAYIARIQAAVTLMQEKTDELVDDMIAELEEKVKSLDSTEKLIDAVQVSLNIDSELFDKVSMTNAEAYGARLVAARAVISDAKKFNKYSLANSMFATTTAEGGMGVYVTPEVGGDSPVVFLKDQVSALNVNIELNMKRQGSGFFAIQLMEKMESFYNVSGTDVAGNKGVVLRINKANEQSKSYDVTVYVIRATSANGFEGCFYTRFTAPISEDGKLNVVFIQNANYVDVIVNGTKMISNRITKTMMQGIYGSEFKGYLSVMSTCADGELVGHEYEINRINGKNVFAENVAEPVVVEATSVTLNKTSAELNVYENLLLTATVNPADTTDNSVTWSSSNEDILIVDETGYVTALAVGEATITVTTSNGLTATCTIRALDENGKPGESTGGKGCGSVVGGGLAALVSVAAAVGFALKKKED